METIVAEDYLFATVMPSNDSIASGGNSRLYKHDWQISSGRRGGFVKSRNTPIVQSGAIVLCLTLPIASEFIGKRMAISPPKHSIIEQIAQITEWVDCATVSSLPESVITDLNQNVKESIFLEDVDVAFLDSEGDFMHIMATQTFEVNIKVDSVVEGIVHFYDTEPVDIIDEPFYI